MSSIDKQTQHPVTETIEATKEFPSGRWRQTLRVSRVGSTMYIDEGNGSYTIWKL